MGGECSCAARHRICVSRDRKAGCKHMVALAYLYLPPVPYRSDDVLRASLYSPPPASVSAAELIGEASEEELRNLVVDALEAFPAARLQTALALAGRCPRRWVSVAALLRSASDPLADFEVEPRMYRNVADRCDLSAPAWVLYADDAVSRLLEWARSCEDRAEPAAAAMPVLAFLFLSPPR